ncbi:MAG TPA: phosphatidylglycerol lysyltransferase domain-containing protein [Mycobacteriales bacterium]|nr:phosphatidylglycerol lysyltransferase domain-containing protein [Mycobacteriales bacterium]
MTAETRAAKGVPARPAPPKPVESRRWVPRVAGLLTYFAGLLDLASALTPAEHSRVKELTTVVPGAFTHAATAATVVSGLLLLMLAHSLRRRKRRAWRAVVALLGASVALHVVKGLDVEEAVVAAVVLAGLVYYRREFRAKGDPRTRWRALGVGLMLVVVSFLLGVLMLGSQLGHVTGDHSVVAVVRHVAFGLVGVHGPLRFDAGGARADGVIGDTLLALGVLTALTVAYLALRTPEPRPHLTPDDEERLRALLARHGGRDSLGYFALRRDKSLVWSPTGKAAVAYRVVSGVLLASGDPVGDPEAWPGALKEFLALAEDHAWVPAVIGCGEQAGAAWVRAGLTALEIGDEAIVDVAEFGLEGRAMRNVRQCVVHVEREGYTARVRRVRDIPPEELDAVRNATSAWRGAETERGFSMALGRIGDGADPETVLVTAYEDGRLRGFLHFVPWGTDGLSLDVMRRDRDADRGLNEFLIVSALRAAPGLGVTRVSLNFAVFRSALERGERLGAGPIIRLWRGVLLFASRWFQIETLYRFNAKFRPVWEPRYVCFPAMRDVPRIAVAALEAEAFIVWPTKWMKRLPFAP